MGVHRDTVQSPLLFFLFISDFRTTSNSSRTYADDTTIIGPISKDNEDAYRLEAERLRG